MANCLRTGTSDPQELLATFNCERDIIRKKMNRSEGTARS